MAGTAYSEIYDSFLMLVKDYRLQTLYDSSLEDFETYLIGFLMPAILEFSPVCDQDLGRDDDKKEFDETLTEENINLLSQLMVKYWMMKNTQDVLQMNLHLSDKDFRHFSENANLKEKSEHLNSIKETISQMLLEYGYRKTDWSAWASGNFGI